MGVVRQALIRLSLRFTSLLISAIASILLARRLDVHEYAIYQTLTKRVYLYTSLPSLIAGHWAYRYAAQKVKGALKMHFLITLVTSIIGFTVALGLAQYLGVVDLPTLLLLSLGVAVWMLYNNYQMSVNAVCPVYTEAISLLYKFIYSCMIISIAYTIGLRLLGAAFSCTLAASIVFLFLIYITMSYLREPLCKRCLGEWIRGSWIPFIGWLSSMLAGLDVLIVRALAGEYVIAAFFASTAIMRMLVEVVSAGAGHLQAYVLRTSDVKTTLNTIRALAVIAAFTLGYSAARPEQIIALMNPAYISAAPALRIYALVMLLFVITAPIAHFLSGLDKSMADKPGKILKQLALASLASAILYIVLIPFTLIVFGDILKSAIILWIISLLATRIFNLIIHLRIAGKGLRFTILKSVIVPSLFYLVLSYVISSFLAPQGYHERFIDDAMLILRGVIVGAPIYILVLLLLDSWVRQTMRVIMRKYLKIR